MRKSSEKISKRYINEAIEEDNNNEQYRVIDNLTNHTTVILNGREYIVVDTSYEDFLRVTTGIDMDNIEWTNSSI